MIFISRLDKDYAIAITMVNLCSFSCGRKFLDIRDVLLNSKRRVTCTF